MLSLKPPWSTESNHQSSKIINFLPKGVLLRPSLLYTSEDIYDSKEQSMGFIKREYFIKLMDINNELLALYSIDSLICKECAEKAGYESWNIDENFARNWITPRLESMIENSYAWCDKCGKDLWNGHKGRWQDELKGSSEENGKEFDEWLDEHDEDNSDWLDELDDQPDKQILNKLLKDDPSER
jgi:hypothetical protein